MAEEKIIAHARSVYASLCEKLERDNWKFERDDENMKIIFAVSGEDIPMVFSVSVDAKRQLLRLLSRIPFDFPEDKRIEGAIATCVATYRLADGSFDYDISDGSIYFRQTVAFMDSDIGDRLFDYLIDCAVTVVDRFNDRFYEISQGRLSIDDFIAQP